MAGYHHGFYSIQVFYAVLALAINLKGEWATSALPQIHIFWSLICLTPQCLITHSPTVSQMKYNAQHHQKESTVHPNIAIHLLDPKLQCLVCMVFLPSTQWTCYI